jgi:SAM-dependent methyltransferase
MAIDPGPTNPPSQTAKRVAQLDLDFAFERSESRFSHLHWHPCRYPSQIPSVVVGRLTEPGDLVLDPFLGSGTTLTEAQRLGRRGVGVDINPVATLVAKAKLSQLPSDEIERGVEGLIRRLQVRWRDIPNAPLPAGVQGQKWYTPQTLSDLSKLWSVTSLEEGDLGTISQAAFSSILLPVCRETRHWGYVCDNSEPKGDYERDVLKAFVDKLRAWVLAYKERDAFLGRSGSAAPEAKVVLGDARLALSELPNQSVKLVLTSPPYSGVADYVKAQRLSMEWFGEEIEPFRQKEIGARSKRHRKAATEEYVEALLSIFMEAHRVLLSDGWFVMVIGQSSQRKATMPLVTEAINKAGFDIQATNDRQISTFRRQMPSLSKEAVIFMRKTSCSN